MILQFQNSKIQIYQISFSKNNFEEMLARVFNMFIFAISKFPTIAFRNKEFWFSGIICNSPADSMRANVNNNGRWQFQNPQISDTQVISRK